MVNIENAKLLVQDVQRHREAFDMNVWIFRDQDLTLEAFSKLGVDSLTFGLEDIDSANTTCGTTLCLAGFAAMRMGWKQRLGNMIESGEFNWISSMMIAPWGSSKHPNDVNWEKIGADFLDLPQVEACRLFHYIEDNTTALEALIQLSEGVDPKSISLLNGVIELYCDCEYCDCEYDDEEDSE
jgi:hypothetical protein